MYLNILCIQYKNPSTLSIRTYTCGLFFRNYTEHLSVQVRKRQCLPPLYPINNCSNLELEKSKQ